MYVPLKVPAGVFANGTDLQSEGRWRSANLVRWYEGVMRPVGGWRKRFATALTGSARGAMVWVDNDGARYLSVGTHSKLYALPAGLTPTDITPAGYSVGRPSAISNSGYGTGTYGASTYGTPRVSTINTGMFPATTWKLENWGEDLIACANTDGKIYTWTPGTVGPATVLANAPIDNRSVVVSAERFLFALGAGGDARRVQWSDQENNTLWAIAPTNQAGSFALQTQGAIVNGRRVSAGVLILTDADAHLATYAGPPFIYRFDRVGMGCGLIGPNAIASAESMAIWMGKSGFWLFDGYARSLPSDVSDLVYSDINLDQASKIFAVHNDSFGEMWFFYPSAASAENDRYVIFNYRENHWSTGELTRTCGADVGIFDFPIMIDASGYVYDHDVGFDYSGAQPYAQTGPVQFGAGDRVMVARQLVPDERTQGDVEIEFVTNQYPNAPTSTYGPYQMSAPTDVRFTARQVRMRVQSNRNTDWRVGVVRLEAVPGGGR
jgi:hypothetical protein